MNIMSTMSPENRWSCALIGAEPLLIQCATMLIERGHHISAIVSQRAEIRDWAQANEILLLDAPADLLDDRVGAVDYLFSVANLSILSSAVLARARIAAINFHDGPLPDMGGVNTPIWALLTGARHHGVTWHVMAEQVDAGAILASQRFDLDRDETAHSINTKCFAAAVDTFARLIDDLASRPITAIPGAAPIAYFGKDHRPFAAATIDWRLNADMIAAFVRHLDFAGHANPMGAPKFRVGGDIILVGAAAVELSHSSAPAAPPGTIIRADAEAIIVATGDGALRLTRLASVNGTPLTTVEAIMRFRLRAGMVLDCETSARKQALSALDAAVARHEPWWRARLGSRDPLVLSLDGPMKSIAPTPGIFEQPLSTGADSATIRAAVIAYLGRIADRDRFDIDHADPVFTARFAAVEQWFTRRIPITATIDFDRGLVSLRTTIEAEVQRVQRRTGYSSDLLARSPELIGQNGLPIAVVISDDADGVQPDDSAALSIIIHSDGRAIRWCHDSAADPTRVAALAAGFATFLTAAVDAPDQPVGQLPIMDEGDRIALLAQGTGPKREGASSACLHTMFADAARRTPHAPAVTSRGVTLNYAELDSAANRLANHLRTFGVGPDVLVGLHLDRSVDLLVALIAIHKAGGAYVPLDPAYPRDRIAHMVHDSGTRAIITQDRVADWLPETDAAIIRIDRDRALIDAQPATCPESGVTPANLAYVIYTSGSTGLPKGVMVEHRNAANFFAGMDAVVEPGGTWLAVTSLSFDISVLELYWTVTRGCHVVIATGQEMTGEAVAPARDVSFSLFYFASADGGAAADQYRLLLEGARFADTHDFEAVWTPERHFHAFGGLYPNPSVTSAAIAAVTSRVAIRGGSVVVPLHHPIRVAEEWSLVDNLSNGRVGIAFASGWQPNDFVLRPESFADKAAALADGVDTVRALWRGETRAFPGPLGQVDIAIYPRPVQRELPFWITSAGNPETFAAAGRMGANILTHLLGQTVEELREKLAAYRTARREAGHAGDGRVTLMLHTFVGQDEAAVRAAVRQPLTDYLRTSTNLVKEFAWSFPAFKNREGTASLDLGTLSEEEMAGLLDHAFERYYETGGLFGTPERCLKMVDTVRAAGVDEIGCLIDFGVPVQAVLDHLPALDALRRRAQTVAAAPAETLGGLMQSHRVTHLQCTPSLAQMLVSDDEARPALRALRQMLVGGEAFPPALAAELRALVGGTVHNMYGPTETTIWSSTHQLSAEEGAIPLGTPLANQQLHVLDSRGQPLPWDVPGELVIGGAGVVRGYLDRPELTAERFVADPFVPQARCYRTGDLAVRRRDGTLMFLGRRDHQVKIRGHRIELGEIEAAIGRYFGIAQVIVTAREDVPGDVRLIGYHVAAAGSTIDASALREYLGAQLPDFMVPAHLVALPALPHLPNGKIDRAALPPPDAIVAVAQPEAYVAPESDAEQQIAAIWREVLNLQTVGTRDNFFDIGGHSLLAVQVHRRLREALGRPLPLTDIFRFPTIRALAAHVGATGIRDATAAPAPTRAAGRRAAMQRRLGQTPAPIRVDA